MIMIEGRRNKISLPSTGTCSRPRTGMAPSGVECKGKGKGKGKARRGEVKAEALLLYY